MSGAPFQFGGAAPSLTDLTAVGAPHAAHPHGSSGAGGEGAHRASIKAPAGGGGIQTLKRAQVFAELSRARRNENFNKRRRGHEEPSAATAAEPAPAAAPAMSEAEVQTLLQAFRASYVMSAPTHNNSQAVAPTAVPSPSVSAADRARLLHQLRLLLSNDDAPVAAVVAAGVVPCLVAELGAHVAPSGADQQGAGASSQLDAIWCLTNIASDTTAHTRAVLPAAPALISFLSSASVRVQEQCVWCLGNLASEEQECRSQLLDNGILLPLIRLLQQACLTVPPPPPAVVPAPKDPAQLTLARVASWALSNLIKTSRSAAKAAAGAGAAPDAVQKHLAAFAAAAPQLLPVLFALLRSADDQLAMETMWTVAAWANHGDAVLASLVDGGLLPALLSRMHLLRTSAAAQGPPAVLDPTAGVERDPLASALIPLVRVLGNLAHAQDAMVQSLLSNQLPPAPTVDGAAAPAAPPSSLILVFSTLERSLLSVHRGLKKETCWVISNLAATQLPVVHEALVLNERGEPGPFLHGLFALLRSASFDIQREAAHALYNLCRCADGRFLPVVLPRVPEGPAASSSPTVALLRVFCDFLRSRDGEAILIALRVLELLLSVHPDGVRVVEHEGGIDALEAVQTGVDNAQLVDYAHRLVDRYFGADSDDDNDAQQQQTQTEEEFPPWRVQQTPPKPPNGGFQF